LMNAIVTVVNNIGSEGMVEIKVNDRRTVDFEFVEGATWSYGWISPAYVTNATKTLARQEDVAVVLLVGKIEDEQQAITGIERLAEMDIKRVAIIADDISEEALRLFTHLHLRGDIGFVLIKAPSVDAERHTAMHDISALTGARVLFDVSEFMSLTPEDIGFARRMWATGAKFGIIGGRRDGDALRGRVEQVRAAIAGFNDKKAWDEITKLRWRLAQLTGGIAVLQVGDLTEPLANTRKEHAERLIQVLQLAVGNGIVAGGGSALLACTPAVEEAAQLCDDPDICFGMRCVGRGFVAPIEVIAHNAGFDPASIRSQAIQAAPGYGFDARTGQIVNMWQVGIVDSLPVVERAIQTAASVAAMIITTTAVIHQKKSYPGPVVP
jgi:chaperonin GroEL